MAKAGRLGSSVGKFSPPFSALCLAAARQIPELGQLVEVTQHLCTKLLTNWKHAVFLHQTETPDRKTLEYSNHLRGISSPPMGT